MLNAILIDKSTKNCAKTRKVDEPQANWRLMLDDEWFCKRHHGNGKFKQKHWNRGDRLVLLVYRPQVIIIECKPLVKLELIKLNKNETGAV